MTKTTKTKTILELQNCEKSGFSPKRKIKRILSYVFAFAILAGLTSNLNAQVTMGIVEKSESGALLQLKNIENVSNGGINSTKGLMLPRVWLTSINDLFPMFDAPYDKVKYDPMHTGLFVYNVHENLFNGDGEGTYVWDGTKWLGMGLTTRSIAANASSIYLSEVNPVSEATLTTTPADLPWTMTSSNNEKLCSYTVSRENDQVKLRFQRDATAATYGNKTYTFTLDNSDKHTDIDVSHLNLTILKETIKVGENGTISSSSIVKAEGGDSDWVVTNYSKDKGFNWTEPPVNKNGKLSFELGSITQTGTIKGEITVAHANDLAYTKKIKIEQNKDYILLPEFDYLVVQYKFDMADLPTNLKVDIDTGTEFSGTNSAADNRPVGWNLESYEAHHITVGGKGILYWPGDNRVTGFEAVYANMTALVGKRDEQGNLQEAGILPLNGPREFDVHMYATWFAPDLTKPPYDGKSYKIIIKISLYRGGTMKAVNTYDYGNFDDQGNEKQPIFTLEKSDIVVNTYQGVERFRKGGYTKMLRLEYDKVDNTGVLTELKDQHIPPGLLRQSFEATTPALEMLPNETKNEFGARSKKYYNKQMTKNKLSVEE